MELRLHMEVSNAELAALRRTEADIRSMETAMGKQHAAHLAGEVGQTEDFSFHLAIANATKNSYMVDFLRFLGPFIIPANAMHQMDQEELPGYQESLRSEHLAIAEAIKSGDASAAGEAMRVHLCRGLQINSNARNT